MDPTFVPTEPGVPTLADRPAAPRRDGRRTVAAILGSAILAASLASATTAFVIEQAPPSGSASSGAATGIVTTALTSGAGSAASSTTNGATGTTVAAVAAVEPAVVTISTSAATGRSAGQVSGIGSGFIYASDGWILTNAHVVEGATSVTVTLADGRDLTGRVVTSDSTADLAVVKVDATGLPTATLGSSSALVVGETVIAIGSPLGTYEGSATSGILSATNRSISVADEATRTDSEPDRPAPDRCRHQPRQQRWTAPRPLGPCDRHRDRRLEQCPGDRVRDPDQRRGPDHGAGSERGRLTDAPAAA